MYFIHAIFLLVAAIDLLAVVKYTEAKTMANSKNVEGKHPVSRGDLPDWGNCGSTGRTTRVSVESCSTNPCFFFTESNYTVVINYIPADPSATLVYKSWYYDFEDNYEDFFDTHLSGIVYPEEEYTATGEIRIPSSLSKARGFISLQVWDISFNHPVVCAEFEALIA